MRGEIDGRCEKMVLIFFSFLFFLLHVDYISFIHRESIVYLYFFSLTSVRKPWYWTLWGREPHLDFGVEIAVRKSQQPHSKLPATKIITYILRACGRPFLFSSTRF